MDKQQFNESLKALNLSGAAFSRLTGYTPNHISKLRNGRDVPPVLSLVVTLLVRLEELHALIDEARAHPLKKRGK